MFSLSVDMGTYQDNRLGTARSLMDKSGAGDLSPDALKKEWYKLGTDFNIGVSDNETNISISGLDEKFEGISFADDEIRPEPDCGAGHAG